MIIYSPIRLLVALLTCPPAAAYFFFWILAKAEDPEATLNLAWFQHYDFAQLKSWRWWMKQADFICFALIMTGTLLMLIFRDWSIDPPSS